ncbi:MAG: isochorismatase family protein [Candidatus Pacearchaeota archaeon]
MERHKAVALIDMQDSFLRFHTRRSREELIKFQSEILEYCAENHLPVLNFQYQGHPETIYELDSLLRNVPYGYDFRKFSFNGFSNHNAVQSVRDLNVKDMFLMGINKHACVMSTSKSALRLGINIYTAPEVIKDPVNTSDYISNYADRWFEESGFYRPGSFWKDFTATYNNIERLLTEEF